MNSVTKISRSKVDKSGKNSKNYSPANMKAKRATKISKKPHSAVKISKTFKCNF